MTTTTDSMLPIGDAKSFTDRIFGEDVRSDLRTATVLMFDALNAMQGFEFTREVVAFDFQNSTMRKEVKTLQSGETVLQLISQLEHIAMAATAMAKNRVQ